MTQTRRYVGAWKLPSFTGSGLKLFACAAMLIYSIGIVIVERGLLQLDQYTQESFSQALAENSDLMVLAGVGSVMQLIGGLAIPIFAFLLVEGVKHTSGYGKYLLTMAAFALISEVPYDLAMSGKVWDLSHQNGLVAMTICLLMLYFLQMLEEKRGVAWSAAKVVLILCAVLWVSIFRAECGLCLVLLTAVFYVFYEKNVLKMVLGMAVSLMYVTGPLAFYGIWCYSGERKDRFSKYVFYAFYPAHLLVLALTAMALGA